MRSTIRNRLCEEAELSALGEFLDALDGVAYVADLSSRLMAVGQENWSASAGENGAAVLTAPLGLSLLDVIVGEDIRAAYNALHRSAARGERRLSFAYRCDGPDVERRMKMSLSPVRQRGEIIGVLYQSTVLSERSRPPLRFLETVEAVAAMKDDRAPIVTTCSFCSTINLEHDQQDEWVQPEEYYRRGGPSAVRLSHGVCPPCSRVISELTR